MGINFQNVDANATTKIKNDLATLQSQMKQVWHNVEAARDLLRPAWQGDTAQTFMSAVDAWEEKFTQLDKELDAIFAGMENYENVTFRADQDVQGYSASWAQGLTAS